MKAVNKPTYDLAVMQKLVGENKYIHTFVAVDGASQLGLDKDAINDCIVNHLKPTDFYKTMEADKSPGLWQDVYYTNYSGNKLYVKLQINAGGKTVIISFKENTNM